MKKQILLFSFLAFSMNCFHAQEKYGNTFNLGAGLGYYGYIGLPVPALNINYEFDLVPNVTLAPFASILHYAEKSYYGGKNYKYNNTVIPIGIKSYYYFDGLFKWDKRFDVYAGLSLGFNLAFGRWDNDYNGPSYAPGYIPVYYELHAGGEYHFKENLGVYLDLSTGLSTVGLAFHL